MNDLIKLSDNTSFPIFARDLYHVLTDGGDHYAHWSRQHIKNNIVATENVDYQLMQILHSNKSGKKRADDFILTMNFAKELCLIARTEKGRIAREYFIAAELKLKEVIRKPLIESNTSVQVVPQSFSEALYLAAQLAETNEKQSLLLEQAKPKVEGYNQFLNIPDKAISIKEAAKLLNCYRNDKPKELMGQNSLFSLLRFIGILQKNNLPYQQYAKYFVVKEVIKVVSGKDGQPVTLSIPMTLVTPYGLERIRKRLQNDGYVFAETMGDEFMQMQRIKNEKEDNNLPYRM
jgi:anti-repressor protein